MTLIGIIALVIIVFALVDPVEQSKKTGIELTCAFCGKVIEGKSAAVQSNSGMNYEAAINYIVHDNKECRNGVINGKRYELGNTGL